VRHSSVAFDLPQESPDLSKDLQEALLTKDLKAVFSRASNLIREAGGVDGSIFFDASIGSFGAASETDVMGQKAPGTFQIDDAPTTSEDELARRSSDTDTSNKDTTKPTENCCNILGFSTRKRSSLRGHTPPPEHHTFPERVLRTLLKRYPHGKVFNFDEDGSFSSSDSDNAYLGKDLQPDVGPRRFTTSDGKKRISREAEAAALLSALPGARSVFWFPLWDSNRERWYAGSLVWSTCPTRILCPIEDLTYLAAFGNSIMAEVSRLSALVLTQMKTDFISSISHELRSPLHGVLASVEFLQETSMSEVQADMVSNINASGRVLLDTINHVLDFSKVNKRVKEKGRKSRRRMGKRAKSSSQNQGNAEGAPEDAVDMCILSEEVLESVYAGRKLSYNTSADHKKSSRPQSMVGAPTPRVTVIMDIGWRPNWNFEMDAGAWRRIMLNLFGNAMKYTKTGYIKVSLNVEEDSTSRNRKSRSMFVLRVKDSGKGISKEFLKHHLYKPFTQEDSLAVGAGLGLSIVRHIIQDLGGSIDFTSEQGVGTEVTVKLPLLATKQPQADDPASIMVREVKEAACGHTFNLEGFDRYPDISETPTGILSADFEGCMFLKSNVHTLLTEWFDMEPAATQILDKSASDLVVLMESGFGTLDEKLQYYKELRTTGSGPASAIVLCNEYPPTSQLHAHEPLKVFYVPQP
jgi:signal transduction histidine kinase